MSRLDTMRTYFIERFFALLTADTDFATLTGPKELFNAAGAFDVPLNAAGFVRMPTLAALDARIAAASSTKKKKELRKFRDVLERTLSSLFGSLADLDAAGAMALARRFAPVIRHPDSQHYWPADTERLLKHDDGTLRGEYYDNGGRQLLSGGLVARLFEPPDAWAGAGLPGPPFESRVPFAATIGVEGSATPFPGSPLTAGHLNLPAADVRLTPGLFQPTIFAEAKSLSASLRNHADYLSTAALGGRFAPLAGNRIQTDPVTMLRSLAVSDAALGGIGDTMLVFHGFYPADDGARRMNDGTGTNREFHHLAVGVVLGTTGEADPTRPARDGFLMVTSSPTTARVLPLGHPSIRFVDDGGNDAAGGTHPVVYASEVQPQGYAVEGVYGPYVEPERPATDYDPEDKEWWAGLGAYMEKGFQVGSFAGGVGGLIGSIVNFFAFLLEWLRRKLFGGEREWTEGHALDKGAPERSYTQSATHDIGPSGSTSGSGGATPARSYDLKFIPHLPDDNLYGLAFAGADTFRIVDDAERQEMLAWHAFQGGIGYQFDRPIPGRAETSGTSIRNYFSLFLRKMQELRQAQAQVVYFGA